MKGIRRFQRTMIVTLVGLNILVFSSSFSGNFSSALGHAIVGMGITGVILIGFGVMRKGQEKKKTISGILESQEN